MKVIYAHGLEGSPEGNKARALRAAGFDLVAPDCRKRALVDRVALLEEAVAAHPGAILLGSSYGGLASLVVAGRSPLALHGLVLLAPALHWNEPPVDDCEALVVPGLLRCTVIHGVRDDIVDIQVSRRLRDRSPHITLIEVDDGHRLAASHEVMCNVVTSLQG